MHAQVFCIYSAYDVRMHVRTQAVPALSLLVKVHATAFLVLSISVPHIWPLAFSILLCLQPAVGEAVSFCPKPGGFRAGDEDRLCESNPEPAEASSEEKVEAKHRAASASWQLNQEYGRGVCVVLLTGHAGKKLSFPTSTRVALSFGAWADSLPKAQLKPSHDVTFEGEVQDAKALKLSS